MNLTVKDEFKASCQGFGDEHFLITRLPSENLLINHIFAIIFNSIVIIPTLLLNAVAVITILKSQPLRSKPCYFIILLQSMLDLAVGMLGIPSFIFLLTNAIGGISNCLAVFLAVHFLFVPMGVSTIITTAMTIERYIAILHPYVYKIQVTKRKTLVSVCSSTVMDIFLMNLSWRIQTLVRIYVIMKFTCFLCLTAYAYGRIYSVVRKLVRSQKKPHDETKEINLGRMKLFLQQIKQARSSFIVVVCLFTLCFLPPVVATPFAARANEFEELGILIWVFSINLFNSTANSVIFFWTKKMLRKEALKVLKRN